MIQKTILMLLVTLVIGGCNNATDKGKVLSSSDSTNNSQKTSNKQVVETYMQGFREGDHAKILACLTDSVVWEMTGLFHWVGKAQFDKEIENDAFEGKPTIAITRMVEEGDIVVAEGTVQCKIKNGGILDATFCDVFHFDNGKIKRLTGYLMQNKQP